MFEKLRIFFERSMPISDEQFAFIKTQFIPKTLKKSDILIREGEVARYGCFVAKGCLRTYTIDHKGKEHIIQFSIENWWVGDNASFLTGCPAAYYVDAVEASEVLLCDYGSFQKVLAHVPGLAANYELGLQKHMVAKNKRITSALSATAEERYQEFLKTYPSIAQRVPQHMIASYLGISPETLSRIRKHLSSKI